MSTEAAKEPSMLMQKEMIARNYEGLMGARRIRGRKD